MRRIIVLLALAACFGAPVISPNPTRAWARGLGCRPDASGGAFSSGNIMDYGIYPGVQRETDPRSPAADVIASQYAWLSPRDFVEHRERGQVQFVYYLRGRPVILIAMRDDEQLGWIVVGTNACDTAQIGGRTEVSPISQYEIEHPGGAVLMPTRLPRRG